MNARILLSEALTVAAACLSTTSSVVATGEAVNGKWVDVQEVNNSLTWPIAMHALHVPIGDGKVVVWGLDFNNQPQRHPMIWNAPMPGTGGQGTVADVDTGLITGCAGHAGLADGRVLVAGGLHGVAGVTAAAIFTTKNGGQWSDVGDMDTPRYYPTLTTLPNGKILVTGGTVNDNEACSDSGVVVYECQVFDPSLPPESPWEGEFLPPVQLVLQR